MSLKDYGYLYEEEKVEKPTPVKRIFIEDSDSSDRTGVYKTIGGVNYFFEKKVRGPTGYYWTVSPPAPGIEGATFSSLEDAIGTVCAVTGSSVEEPTLEPDLDGGYPWDVETFNLKANGGFSQGRKELENYLLRLNSNKYGQTARIEVGEDINSLIHGFSSFRWFGDYGKLGTMSVRKTYGIPRNEIRVIGRVRAPTKVKVIHYQAPFSERYADRIKKSNYEGIIPPESMGVQTGRFSATKPNMEEVPKKPELWWNTNTGEFSTTKPEDWPEESTNPRPRNYKALFAGLAFFAVCLVTFFGMVREVSQEEAPSVLNPSLSERVKPAGWDGDTTQEILPLIRGDEEGDGIVGE